MTPSATTFNCQLCEPGLINLLDNKEKLLIYWDPYTLEKEPSNILANLIGTGGGKGDKRAKPAFLCLSGVAMQKKCICFSVIAMHTKPITFDATSVLR